MSSIISYTEVEKIVKANLKESRFIHSLGVSKVASMLSKRFLLDEESGLYVGIYHDRFRYLNDDELLSFCKKQLDDITPEEEEVPMLLHGAYAALMMKKEVGDIPLSYFKAIRHHTLGSINMGPLGASLYVADYTEPNRKHISDDEKKYILSLDSLEEMVLYILFKEVKYFSSINKEMSKRTLLLKEYLEEGGIFV